MKNFIIPGVICIALFSCNRQAEVDAQIQAAKQATEDSIRQVEEMEELEARQQPQQTIIYQQSPDATSTTTTTTTTEEKKGWSNAAKGALIGAGAGAITGAAVSKDKKGKGAIIGGVVGAGAGAATGVVIDKRKEKKENEE